MSSIALLAAVAAFAPQGGVPNEIRLMRFPTVHGENVVFSYAGDLWLSKKGGEDFARKLTSSYGMETRPRISPDGKLLAFTGQYDGNSDVFVVPLEGGEPKRLTFEPEAEQVIGWTPDGKVMYTSNRGFTNRHGFLWLVSPQGGLPESTPVKEISEGSFSPDGSTLAYNRAPSQNYNWRRYRGGTQGRVSFFNLKAMTYKELPAKREQSYYPMWVGDSVYYISDRNQGTLNLYRHDLKSGKDVQLTKYADADIRFPSTDGKTIVWERDGNLYAYDIAADKAERLNPKVRGDFVTRRAALRNLGQSISGASLSPTGARLAVEARGEIFSVPAKNGETRNLTNSTTSRERLPSWSPDGKSIAYISDATGEYEVYLVPQMGGTAEKLTSAKQPIDSITWSPDGKKILVETTFQEGWVLDVATKQLTKAFKAGGGIRNTEWSPDSKWISWVDAGDGNDLSKVELYDVANNKNTPISDGRYGDTSATFDQTGKYLYLVSDRTFTPSFGLFEFSLKVQNAARIYAIPLTKEMASPLVQPSDEEPAEPPTRPSGPPPGAGGPPSGPRTPEVKIDFDGIMDRAVPLPMPAGSYPLVLGSANGVFFWTPQAGMLSRYDIPSGQIAPVLPVSPQGLTFNASRSKLAFLQQGQLQIADLRPGAQPAPVSTANVRAVVDPQAEWKQMFWETWRYERDNFYDPNMAGQNWDAIGKRYEAYLPYVAHRADLNYVLGLMIGELGTGHSYVQGTGDPQVPMPTPVPIGLLGVDYEAVGNDVKIKKILNGANDDEGRRSPLQEPGLKIAAGDYLLEIDGQPVNKSVNPHSLLQGKANATVVLTVNDKPSKDGARKVRVRTVGSETELRYWDYVESNRKYVEKASGGRIGYVHIPDTQFPGAVEFIRGFYSNLGKEAMVIDERWNGGGFIQPWFVDTLARKIKAGIKARTSEKISYDAPAQEGPMALLINQYAGSGGDFFPWMFRQAKRGPLIGKRTWGGLVGISGGANLVDGGSVTAPSFAIFDRETNEIIAENRGIDPDIDVDLRPDLFAQGKDPQLDKAIEHLMNELKNKPAPKPRPAVPKLGKEAKIGG